MTNHVGKAALAVIAIFAVACSDTAESPHADGGTSLDAGDSGDGSLLEEADADGGSAPESGKPDAGQQHSVPFSIGSYPYDGGKYFLVTISVNGSPPIDVLLDTGSNGLRVFAEALGGTSVDVGAEVLDAEFGYGNTMAGHVATGTVSFGDLATPEPIDFHLVESFECASWNPSCDFADGSAALLTNDGIHGILGVSTRAGMPARVYSPFAQLASPLSDGYIVHTGGFESTQGEITFGKGDATGFALVDMPAAGSLPNGLPAWGDDRLEACFAVDGQALAPPCTEVVIDTGSSADVLYAPNLDAQLVQDDALAPGAELAVTIEPALDMKFTVGQPPTAGVDLVFVDMPEPFAILGAGLFFRYDVLIDQAGGRIGFNPL